YDLRRSGDSGASWSTIASPTSETATDAPFPGSYYYEVRARDGAGNVSSYSGPSTSVIVDWTAPTVPAIPSGFPNPANGSAVTISWAASTDSGLSGLCCYDVARSGD